MSTTGRDQQTVRARAKWVLDPFLPFNPNASSLLFFSSSLLLPISGVWVSSMAASKRRWLEETVVRGDKKNMVDALGPEIGRKRGRLHLHY